MKGLEEERKLRRIGTISEVVRIIVSEYFRQKDEKNSGEAFLREKIEESRRGK